MTKISVKGLVEDSDEESIERPRKNSLERRASELISSMERVRRRKERSLESRARQLHFKELGIRDRSPGGREGGAKGKRKVFCSFNEDSLIFEVCVIDRDGMESTVSAFGLLIEEAEKLTWKSFKTYMVRNSGLEKTFSRKSEVKVFYVDEEEDEIFVDTDDEYRAMIKVAAEKNKGDLAMVLNLLSVCKTRRNRVDLLAREVKGSPGKIKKNHMSPNPKHSTYETLVSKVWKKEVKQDGDKVTANKGAMKLTRTQIKPIKVTLGYQKDETEEESTSSESSSSSGFGSQDQDKKFLKERALNFDWLNTRKQEKQEPTPLWFHEYMESYKDELTAEITAQVVKSLGVVLDNKLNQHLNSSGTAKRMGSPCCCIESVKRKGCKENKRDERSDQLNVLKEQVDKKDSSGAEAGSRESKELQRLKKSILKKADRVAKVAKKMEKKKIQEDKKNKSNSSSFSDSEQESAKKISDNRKKEIEQRKKTKDNKIKRRHKSKETSQCEGTSKQRETNLVDTVMKDILETDEAVSGKLSPALYLLEKNRLSHKVQPGQTINEEIHIINMSAITWWKGYQPTCQRSFSSNGLHSDPLSTLDLPYLKPGAVGSFSMKMTAPHSPGKYESIWHFYKDQEVFGPALKFEIVVEDVNKTGLDHDTIGTEMKDFGGQIDMDKAQEMKKMGCEADGMEMIEIISSKKIITIGSESEDDDDAGLEKEFEDKEDDTTEVEKGNEFDLLVTEVDSLQISKRDDSRKNECEEDFEVVPIPKCFDLDIPFELVDTVSVADADAPEKYDKDTLRNLSNSEIVECDLLSEFEEAGINIQVKDTPLKEIIDLDEQQEIIPSISVEKCLKIENESMPMKEIVDIEHIIDINSEEEDDREPENFQIDMTKLEKLINMGFAKRDENIRLLRANKNDLEKVLEALCFSNSNSWSEVRH